MRRITHTQCCPSESLFRSPLLYVQVRESVCAKPQEINFVSVYSFHNRIADNNRANGTTRPNLQAGGVKATH